MATNESLLKQVADLSTEVADLRRRQVRWMQAEVTDVDTVASTIEVAVPEDEGGGKLGGITWPAAFLPDIGDTVRLIVAGAQPMHQANGLAVDAVTGRELAPGSVGGSNFEPLVILGSVFVAGDPTGNRIEIDSLGIRRYLAGLTMPTVNIPGGVGGSSYFQVSDAATGDTLANVDSDGNINGRTGRFEDLYVGGQKFVPPRAEDQESPRGFVEYGGQYINSVGTSSEIGVYEVAADLEVGRMYLIESSYLAFTGPTGALARARLRMTTDGSTPILTSTPIATIGGSVAAANDTGGTLRRAHTPSVTGTHRFLLTVIRTGGTAGNVGLTGSDAFPIQVWVDDKGPYRGNNAVTNDGGGVVTNAVKTVTKKYSAIWSGSYLVNDYYAIAGNEMRAGIYDNGNDLRAMVGFNSAQIMADLAGATIESCIVYLYAHYWYYDTGGTAIIGTHNNSARPATWIGVNPARWQSPNWPSPSGRRLDLGVTVGNEFKAGTTKGLCLGPAPVADLIYFGRFRGASATTNLPYLEIRYAK